jgi:hypothetical protein
LRLSGVFKNLSINGSGVGYVVEKIKKKRYYRGLRLNSKKLAGKLKIHRYN